MKFTDANLKRLKERTIIDSKGIMVPTEMLRTLLSRLEAAEKVCVDAFNLRNDNHLDCRGGEKCRMGPNVDSSLATWRKAKGEG